MNIVEKNILEKSNNIKVRKNQKITFENTKKFSKKYNIKIIDKHIDFLVCKLLEKNTNTSYVENTIVTVYPFQQILQSDTPINKLYNIHILFDKFVLLFSGLAFSEQKKIYNIYDFEKNKIGQLVLRNENKIKGNKNVIDSLELSGLFFHSYNDYLKHFLSYFGISTNKNGVLKRLDYCLDLGGIEVFELCEYLKKTNRKTKNVNALTATDKKKLLENNTDIQYGRKETYKNFFSTNNDLKIYDKILDVLENYKSRKVNGLNPYQLYLDSPFPITRLELKKKKFTNLHNNSIDWVFQNIEALFFDYLLRYFTIDISLYIGDNTTLNGKKIFLAKEQKSKSLFHSITMALAYLNNIKDIAGEKELYRFLYKNFPELENIKPLDLATEIDISDFFSGISDTTL